MNNILAKIFVLSLATLFLAGCYNNSHVRTQRVLEPDDKIISGFMSANLLSTDSNYDSERIRTSGISGLRVGLSYLGHHNGYEQGANVAYGNNQSLIVGYDIRSVRQSEKYRPYRYGLHLELNNIFPTDEREYNSDVQEASVMLIRPYMISTTSPFQEWYVGIHGIASFGNIASSQYINVPNQGSYYSSDVQLKYDYSVSALGAGFTLGYESQFGNLAVQTQLDLSFLSQKHEITDDEYLALVIETGDDWGIEPLDQLGPIISLGMAVNRTPKPKQPQPSYSTGSMSPAWLPDQPPTPQPKYDPFTGEEILPEPEPVVPKYDPNTGELITPVIQQKFDPLTGLAIPPTPAGKVSPYSLLTPREQSVLMVNSVKIVSLNGVGMAASLLDVQDTGLLVFREAFGKAVQETIPYEKINTIRFAGARGGFKRGVSAATTGCGIGIGVPLAVSLMTGEGFIFDISLVASPVVGIGSFLYGSLSRDSYTMQFFQVPANMTGLEYRRQNLQQLIQIYVVSGFPKHDITKPTPATKP